jgi:hypothetical protein
VLQDAFQIIFDPDLVGAAMHEKNQMRCLGGAACRRFRDSCFAAANAARCVVQSADPRIPNGPPVAGAGPSVRMSGPEPGHAD